MNMDIDDVKDVDADIDTRLGKMRLESEEDEDSEVSNNRRDENSEENNADSEDNTVEDSNDAISVITIRSETCDDDSEDDGFDYGECFNELLKDCIWDVAIECHRATKLNYFSGKLAPLLWKRGSEFLPQEPEPEINPDGKKKRTKKKMKKCLCHCCKKEVGPTYFANHLSKCLFKSGTYRAGAQKSYVEKSFYSDDDDLGFRRRRKPKSKPRKPAAKSTSQKDGPSSATTKKSTPRKPSKPRKPAYDYPALLDMSHEEKKTFFAEHCGVKLKTSKKNAICSRKASECQVHEETERETIRRMHLSIEHKGGTYAYC